MGIGEGPLGYYLNSPDLLFLSQMQDSQLVEIILVLIESVDEVSAFSFSGPPSILAIGIHIG